MIASSLGAGYPAAAGNWADDRSMSGPEYAQSKAICSSLKGLSLPPADRPDGLRQRRSRDGAPRRSNSGSVLQPCRWELLFVPPNRTYPLVGSGNPAAYLRGWRRAAHLVRLPTWRQTTKSCLRQHGVMPIPEDEMS